MTLAIAEILADCAGRITIVADTKVTSSHDVTQTRHVYTNPCLKIVIVDDDVAVAFAGDNPESALRHVARLRGRTATEIIESLRQYSADHDRNEVSKSFLIAKRAPDPQLWRIVRGGVEAAGNLPRLWIGDKAAFTLFQRQHQAALLDAPQEQRLVVAMQTLVMFDDIPTVGGYVTRVTGDARYPFRFHSDPARSAPWATEGSIVVEPNGRRRLTFRVPPGGDPSRHQRIGVPGRGETFGAMTFYIPEVTTAWLWTHDEPWRPAIKLRGVRTIDQLLRTAAQNHGQLLSSAELDEA